MIGKLFEFIKTSPTAFHTVDSIECRLNGFGFEELKEDCAWKLSRGGKYYVTRNSSSIIAFCIGKEQIMPFRITASHSDSPMFKVKENAELKVRDKYVQLNTEGYGGMICSTWQDRPLSLAGRLIVKEDGELKQRLVNPDCDMVLIPSLAIHMNRKVNEGVELNKQIDMVPLFGAQGDSNSTLKSVLAKKCGIKEQDIYGQDIYVYNRMEPSVWGADEEYISAPRLDDLMCAYASLEGFCDSDNDEVISVYACFDNEEVGSDTLQGAGSSFFEDTLRRIGICLGYNDEDFHCMLAKSLMLSEDNGHALHPNHPEKSDSTNCVYMNEGVVVKSHAGQKYASDGIGVAICKDIAAKAGIPLQFYSNRSDEAGGSTLGNISACRVPIRTVDIGLAQLAMHSAYETAGAKDIEYMKKFNIAFYECKEKISNILDKDFRKMSDGTRLYRCACCKKYTLQSGRGMHDICPVCFWEDDSVQNSDMNFEGGANSMSLRQAQINYRKIGACSEDKLEYVRPARPEEE